jgi:hypothetical protein
VAITIKGKKKKKKKKVLAEQINQTLVELKLTYAA